MTASWKYGISFLPSLIRRLTAAIPLCNKKYRYRCRAGASGPLLQGVSNLFEIDIVKPILDYFAAKAGIVYGEDRKKDVSLRVLTEHLRGVAFLVADGIMPSNEGRGYVLRRILRRAVRHGRLLELDVPLLSEAVPLLVELMGDAYPELVKNKEQIMRVIRLEEERFKETLDQGMEMLENHIASMKAGHASVLPGETAFKLYDTYGFPLDLTREILAESGFTLDEKAFNAALEQQRERARSAMGNQEADRKHLLFSSLVKGMTTEFVGYETLSAEGEVIGIIAAGRGELLAEADSTLDEEELYLVLDRSPFYAERGGQVGDTGLITAAGGGVALVKNTLPGPDAQILHLVEIREGRIHTGEKVRADVDRKRRQEIAGHHTATHLLHRPEGLPWRTRAPGRLPRGSRPPAVRFFPFCPSCRGGTE